MNCINALCREILITQYLYMTQYNTRVQLNLAIQDKNRDEEYLLLIYKQNKPHHL